MSGKEEKKNRNWERIDAIEQKVDDVRTMAAHLEGGKRAALEKKVESLEGELAAVRANAFELETKLGNVHATVVQLVEASNASSVLLSSIERFLDQRYGEGWDDGIRKQAEARVVLLKRRKEIMIRSHAANKMSEEERRDLTTEIWELAAEIGTRSVDVALVISLHLQNRDVAAALDVVEEIHREEIKVAPEVARMVQQLVDRCREIAREQADEVQAARVERVPAIVGPDGDPIPST